MFMQFSLNFLLLKPLFSKVEYNNGFEGSEYYIWANLAIHQEIITWLPWGKHAYHVVCLSVPQGCQYDKAPIVIKQEAIISQLRVQGIDTDA